MVSPKSLIFIRSTDSFNSGPVSYTHLDVYKRQEKTQGLNIEQAQLETTHGLANLAVVSIMAAAQVMALVMAREPKQPIDAQIILNQQEIECSLWLNPTLEGKTDKQKNQHPANSLAFVAWVVARLGGWSPHANKPAGPITMIHGLVRFKAIVCLLYTSRCV